MEKVLLNMKAISKTFGSVQALKEVSLDLYAGEVLALMGENGAGKSTLMNILSGSLQPTKGEIYLKGEKVTVPGPIAAKKLGISKIHQELQIVPELSVAENIFLGRYGDLCGNHYHCAYGTGALHPAAQPRCGQTAPCGAHNRDGKQAEQGKEIVERYPFPWR